VPACLVVGEATWFGLLVNASYNTSHGPRVDLPFLAFAVPATAAVAAIALAGRRGWRWWQRSLVIAALAALGAVVTAGVIGGLTVAGSEWRTATHPWTSPGHRAAVVAGAAWLVAIMTWARGTWLGAHRPSFVHAARSAGISAIAFIGIFAGRAGAREVAFRATTGDAGVLLFVFFPLTGAALLLIRQREIEREALLHPTSGPGLSWLGVLAVPMVAIAAVSLAVAATVGPAARGAARAALAVLRAIGWVLAALGRLLSTGPNVRPVTSPVPPPIPVRPGPPVGSGAHPVTVPGPVWWAICAVGLALAAWFAVRYVRILWPSRWRQPPAPDADEERTSVFTWAHLFAQLRRALRALLARLRPRRRRRTPDGVGMSTPSAGPSGTAIATDIRAAYRRVLVAASRAGSPRSPAETVTEFEGRLAGVLPEDGPDALHVLTDLYEHARYGDVALSELASQRGRSAADAVVSGLSPDA